MTIDADNDQLSNTNLYDSSPTEKSEKSGVVKINNKTLTFNELELLRPPDDGELTRTCLEKVSLQDIEIPIDVIIDYQNRRKELLNHELKSGEIVRPDLSQEVADLIGIDLDDPCKDDMNISFDRAGNEKYYRCCVPPKFYVTRRGIWKISNKIDRFTQKEIQTAELICATPVMVTGLYSSVDATGADMVEISFTDNGKVEKKLVPRVALTGINHWSKFIRANNYGRLDILDTELKELLKFLKVQIKYNRERKSEYVLEPITAFEEGDASERVGWNGKGGYDVFITPEVAYYNDGGKLKVKKSIFSDSRNINANKRVKYCGNLKKWFEAYKHLRAYKKLLFTMYYAVGSMFLGPLKVNNSAFGIIGDTSIGKTFTIQVVASMFGNPSDKGDGLVIYGNISKTALNALLTIITDLAICIDEITMMSEETKYDLTYGIGNGQEALRGTGDGNLRSSKMIRCNALITGEVSFIPEFANNGADARVFSCNDRPIPELPQETIKFVKNTILENHGYILPEILAQYFSKPDNIYEWFNTALKRLQDLTDITVMKRKAEFFALAEVGGHLLEKVFEKYGMEPINPAIAVDMAWKEFALEDTTKPLEIKALEDVYNWASSHPRNFLVGEKQPIEKHPDDIYGWWVYPKMMNTGSNYEYIDLNKQELEKFLRYIGYKHPLNILRYWKIHDIIVCNNQVGKNLLTCAVYHCYHFNQPATQKGIIRIRMDKIRELIEKEEVSSGKQIEYEPEKEPSQKRKGKVSQSIIPSLICVEMLKIKMSRVLNLSKL